MQVELVNSDSNSLTITLFTANRSLLALDLVTVKNGPGWAHILDAGIGPLRSFRAVSLPDQDGELQLSSLLLQTMPVTGASDWYLAEVVKSWRVVNDSYSRVYSLGKVHRLSDIFECDYIEDSFSFATESMDIILAVSAIKTSSDELARSVQFAKLSEPDEPNSIFPYASIDISTSAGSGVSIDSLHLVPFLQAGQNETLLNRTLLALHSSNIVHAVLPPTPPVAGSPKQTFALQWDDSMARTVLFRVENDEEKIFHLELASEPASRPDVASPYVWIYTIVDFLADSGAKTSRFNARCLAEFATFDWSVPGTSPVSTPIETQPEVGVNTNAWQKTSFDSLQTSADLVSVLNPLGLEFAPCPWNRMMNTSGHCQDERPNKLLFQEEGIIIRDMAVRNIPKNSWFAKILPPPYDAVWYSTAITTIFFVEDTKMHVYGLLPGLDNTPEHPNSGKYDTRLEPMNSFNMMGIANRLTVSPNGLHAVPVVSKHDWELESSARLAEICAEVQKWNNQTLFGRAVLEPFRNSKICDSVKRLSGFGESSPSTNKFSGTSVGQFVQYLSLCPSGSFCPSVYDFLAGGIYPGYYSPYPISMVLCEPGYTCPMGFRSICPAGYICPLDGQLLPTPCPESAARKGYTCFAEGLTAPIPAPMGTIPVYAHAPPIPAPPGRYALHMNLTASPKTATSMLADADSLDFTSSSIVASENKDAKLLKLVRAALQTHGALLAASGVPLNNTGLENFAIQLAACQLGEYCALGRDSEQNRKCPAGAYCPSPTSLAPIQCRYNITENFSTYCPEGSFEEKDCPAGFHCTGPAIATACISPYFCPAGSMDPQLCPAGYYCPTPAQKIMCPARHFCVLGSISPTPCAVLSICPPGTKNNNANFILALVFVLVVAALVATWRIVEHRVTKQRLERSIAMQEAEKLLAKARLQQQARMNRIGGDDDEEETDEDGEEIGMSRRRQTGASRGSSFASSMEEDHEDNDADASIAATLLRNAGSSSDTEAERKALLAAQIEQDLVAKMEEVPFKVDISFEELGLKIKGTEKKVLDGVTGTIRSGRVTAVMGPSGAGKTTFMSTLANKAHYGERTGTVRLNGQKGDLTAIPGLVGFVPQEDVMLRELSVTEILNFNAKMRLPSDFSSEKVSHVVRRAVRLLGLYDIRHELIGDETKRGISGGQRKRVNIGMELVAQPSVLFLDEPTSGLDATASLQVCGILRRVAEEAGMTVISVIHQPRYDIFTMFHDVLLLGKGGRTVYLGPTADALTYFEGLGFIMPPKCNPADFLIDVVSGSIPRAGFPEFIKEDLFTLWEEHQSKDLDSSQRDQAPRRSEQIENSSPALPYGSSSSVENDFADDTDDEESGVRSRLIKPQKSIQGGKKAHLDYNSNDSSSSFGERDFVLPKAAKRVTSSIFHQFWWFFVRGLLQQKRNWISILTDVILVLSSGITFGIVFLESRYVGPPPPEICALMPVEPLQIRCGLPIIDPIPQMALMTIIGLALPAAMAALRIFGPERVVWWRESSVGANTVAYFLAKEASFLPSTILLPLLYAGVFYNFTVPRMSFGMLYLIFLTTWFASTGFASLISILVPPALATISTVVVIFGLSLFSWVAVRLEDLAKMWPPFSLISYTSFFRWLVEAYYISEIKGWASIYSISSGIKAMGYKLSNVGLDFGVVIGMAVACRIIALILLELLYRDQRK